MLHVALLEPEIPPNTGNIGRSCVATGSTLHLIGRLGFQMDDRNLKRAGMDYWPLLDLELHASLEDLQTRLPDSRIICLSAHAARPYTRMTFRDGDCLLFGAESTGLPAEVLSRFEENALTIPMPTGKVRSLNLAVAAGVVLYEAMRQLHRW